MRLVFLRLLAFSWGSGGPVYFNVYYCGPRGMAQKAIDCLHHSGCHFHGVVVDDLQGLALLARGHIRYSFQRMLRRMLCTSLCLPTYLVRPHTTASYPPQVLTTCFLNRTRHHPAAMRAKDLNLNSKELYVLAQKIGNRISSIGFVYGLLYFLYWHVN
jgi:hypothetical protein